MLMLAAPLLAFVLYGNVKTPACKVFVTVEMTVLPT